MIDRIHPNTRYSHAIVHDGLVYLSGQVSDASPSVREQTQHVLHKIDKLLQDAGSHKGRVLQAIVWLKDAADFPEMNAAWEAWLPAGQLPARSTCQVGLMGPSYKVEITVVAASATHSGIVRPA